MPDLPAMQGILDGELPRDIPREALLVLLAKVGGMMVSDREMEAAAAAARAKLGALNVAIVQAQAERAAFLRLMAGFPGIEGA
jgi:hypothetical protein